MGDISINCRVNED